MSEESIELEIPLLLPGVEAEDDACLARLEAALQSHKGLQRAHLQRVKRPVTLCLHYDPDILSLADVKRLADRAGVSIVNRYHHAMLTVEGMDCSDCVTVIEHGVARMDGVLAVNVNYATEMMRVEFDAQKVDRGAIAKRVRELGYSIPTGGFRTWYQENANCSSV